MSRSLSSGRRQIRAVCLATALVCLGAADDRSHAADSDLPQQAARILGRYCDRCHRGAGSASGYEFDVRDVATMTNNTVVKAGSPTESPPWTL